ncbi:MAG: ATP phosphoribosyltransferase regulatory subunit [Trueperaceae bacterium]|nr:ATP phosphoribosyltransferase regulatory subunit [Trueperaceae bacterium]
MRHVLADGTRAHLPTAAATRDRLRRRLSELYVSWGYRTVEVPALERYDPEHPRAAQSFKLTDRDSGLLALRSDFTPALARLVRHAWPHLADPASRQSAMRLQVAGPVWQAIDPELARTREFSQIGVELIGVRHPRADAELIHLARESVRTVGLRPRVEIGSPGFVRALMDEAAVPGGVRSALADAIDRKDPHDVATMLRAVGLSGPAADALRAAPDLYGSTEQLEEARRVATGPASRAALDHLEGVLGEFEDDSELILDLGMARRLSYYTGVTFRAYTLDFGQPLLGGGRYDGALLPYAAGFSIGLERLESALADAEGDHVVDSATIWALSTDDAAARRLRAAGFAVGRAIATDDEDALQEARDAGARWLVGRSGLRPVSGAGDADEQARMMAAMEGDDD